MIRSRLRLTVFLIMSLGVLKGSTAAASEPPAAQPMGSTEPTMDLKIPHGLRSKYFVFEITKNEPLVHTKDELDGRHATYYLGYRNQVASDWLMGIGVSHRSFTKQNDENLAELSFLTLQHEAYYIVRLHHPLYLLFGPNILYLLPLKQSYMPLDKDTDFETEIGAGFTGLLGYLVSDQYLLTARVERWRGTRTNLFHAFETAFGVSVKI